jgi:hypothetical protein
MEMCMTTGARYFYFPQRGPVAVPGCLFHRARYGALVNPTGSDLPVTDRMRMSASEP